VEQIGIVEASNRFPDLVARVVQQGQCVTVFQSGVPVVDVVPTRQGQINVADRQKALAKIKSLRRQIKPMGDGEIVALIRDNRP